MLLRIGQHSVILSTSASGTKLAELEVRYERKADYARFGKNLN